MLEPPYNYQFGGLSCTVLQLLEPRQNYQFGGLSYLGLLIVIVSLIIINLEAQGQSLLINTINLEARVAQASYFYQFGGSRLELLKPLIRDKNELSIKDVLNFWHKFRF